MSNKIRPFLKDAYFDFDNQHIEAMGRAFEEATDVLHITERSPPIVHEVIAARIIAVAKDGQRDPHTLCELALKMLRGIIPAPLPLRHRKARARVAPPRGP